jgi:hypothetical protein
MTRIRTLFAAAIALTGLAALTLAPPAAHAAVAPTTLYAVDDSHDTVVRFVGGATGAFASTVIGRNLSSVSTLAPDALGNVYLLDSGRLVSISADGVQRSIAANLTGLQWLVVDGRGTVFVADGHRVTRIYQPSGKQSLMGSLTGQTIEGLGVDGSGRPTVITYPDDHTNAALVTFPSTAGSQPSIRRLTNVYDNGYRPAPLVEAPNGVIFVGITAGGGSGVHTVERVNAGSDTARQVNTRYSDYAWTVDPRGRLHLMQIRKWCTDPDRFLGYCTPNNAVDQILVMPDAGGTPRSVPTSNLSLPPGGIAIGADQTTYAAATAGLVRIPATGGAAQTVVSSGSYSDLVVKPGS